jgi:hypothetical protein
MTTGTQDLSGRWALFQQTVTSSKVPVIGKVYSKTRAVVLFDLTHAEERLSGRGSVCAIEINSGSRMVKTILPPAFRRGLPPSEMDARLTLSSGRLWFFQPRTQSVLGAQLALPDDPLPTSPSDPRVVDQDEDGKPGVTVQIKGIVEGDIYVIQRSWSELTGSQTTPGRFDGDITFGQEQVILGATRDVLKKPMPAAPEPTRSSFKLIKLADDATCASLSAMTKAYLEKG